MEPPKPSRQADVLNNAPEATVDDYQEYERLLSLRYTKDPSNLTQAAAPDPDEHRLKELTLKLFGE